MIKLLVFFGLCAAANHAVVADIYEVTQIGPRYNTNDYPNNTVESVRRALLDMISTFKEKYPQGQEYLKELDRIETQIKSDPENKAIQQKFADFRRKALLANPLLDFDRLLLVRATRAAYPSINSYVNSEIKRNGWDHELAVLSDLRNQPKLQPFFKPEKDRPVRDLELHWNGDKVLFSTIDDAPEANERWGVFEVNLDGTGLRQLTPNDQHDVDFYDACYLPEGDIITASTACMQGLPCENGGRPMAVLYRVNPETKQVRQLTFEQDSDWHPTMLPNGRVMYLRWEYSDIPHYMSRILFSMNPDGTNQMAIYGSGSYFPTAFKHARPIPDDPHQIVGIVGGHHGQGETGRLCIIDPSMGNKYPFHYTPEAKEWGKPVSHIDIPADVYPKEVTGFVQEIPGFGRDVVGNVVDTQGENLKYNFVYPFPLSKKYFLVSMRLAGQGTFGIYLVDIFDNMTLIYEESGKCLLEPIPLVKPELPRIVADRTDLSQTEATVFISDIYRGPGLKDVPRDVVKSLRVFSYHFCYMHSGGHESVGVESSWDIKRILGTVKVEDDGSASFVIPANTPVSIQPLDEKGRAVQLFRSWFVGMPAENVSCVGCHENQANVTPVISARAALRRPEAIKPWHGVPRPVAFATEVYVPVVKKYCLDCHDGSKPDRPSFVNEKSAYDNIHPFINRPGPESDLDINNPYEYHASTSELIVMLEKGHHNVKISPEDWERLFCWIDLNAPYRGKWEKEESAKRRRELSLLYANIDIDPEKEYQEQLNEVKEEKIEFLKPEKLPERTDKLTLENWPFPREQAEAMQKQAGTVEKTFDLGDGVTVKLRRIPAGSFIMGNNDGFPDESPRAVVKINQPFWMGETEITNRQYSLFDPKHDTRYLKENGKDHTTPGYIANHPQQPVGRVSWDEANSFCEWFSQKFGVKAALPTESQWEWAARAGSTEQFYYGNIETDFSKFANLADADRRFLYTSWESGATIHARRPYPENSVYPLRDDRFKDNHYVVDYVAQCLPNVWGLYDIIGNSREWTRSDYKPYPYRDDDGRNDLTSRSLKTARGGSWIDRPKVTGSSTRYYFQPYQRVYNVGFRIVIEEE
ncbi:MAG: SUMF1/EgtB/PvdO family nonheme iron enzyme [Planctomycetaceae bacterium]|jgi:formylglycine-generating enzyme required for sulfatase activity|nr:SUMF1/EgtB/PvdO family nonheme iron enzyme [Planctomycetaceae bacterium]